MTPAILALYNTDMDMNGHKYLLRVPDALWTRIVTRATVQQRSMRDVIIEILRRSFEREKELDNVS